MKRTSQWVLPRRAEPGPRPEHPGPSYAGTVARYFYGSIHGCFRQWRREPGCHPRLNCTYNPHSSQVIGTPSCRSKLKFEFNASYNLCFSENRLHDVNPSPPSFPNSLTSIVAQTFLVLSSLCLFLSSHPTLHSLAKLHRLFFPTPAQKPPSRNTLDCFCLVPI